MKAAIVTIGDEILIGQILDTNSAYLAKVLDENGFEVEEIVTISDTKEAIADTLLYFQDKLDLVVLTGGLGPTKDDVTKKTFCDYFGDSLIQDEKVYQHVKSLMENFYKRPITQMNADQALVPSKAKVLFNKVGTAPGMLIQQGKTIYVSLPGVPFEMKHLVNEQLLPYLAEQFQPFYNIHQTVITQGVGESLLAERISDWENSLPSCITLAYLPSPGMVKLRLSTHGENREKLKRELSDQIQKLQLLLSDCIVSLNENEPLEVALGTLLTKGARTLAVAESCTGGKVAQTLTAIEGTSSFFKGGAVTYATAAKVAVLGVRQETIDQYSVVSEEVAKEMAVGARRIFKTDYALATTGNAGPQKGEADAEIGTVCIALATPDNVVGYTFNFGQPREKVIQAAVNKTLDILYKKLLKNTY